jgi:hypothetical protein
VKKLFAIAFTCVYLLLTVGVNKNTHYCMGRINPPPLHQGVRNHLSSTDFADKKVKNSPEFFILNEFYSEAFVILLA